MITCPFTNFSYLPLELVLTCRLMITKEKLDLNLRMLKSRLPVKPSVYTPEFPKTIAEGLLKYSHTRSVNAISQNINNLNKLNWPLPLWVDPDDIKIGFWNTYHWKKWHDSWPGAKRFKKFSGFEWLWAPIFGDMFSAGKIDERLLNAFRTNLKYFEKRLLANPLLVDKQSAIRELMIVYKERKYNSCISLVFPLIDFVVRKLLNTTNLNNSVSKICKLFKECGFDFTTIDQLMPSVAITNFIDSKAPMKLFQVFETDDFKEFSARLERFNFGIVGGALNSFLWFSNNYYGHYAEDIGGNNIINRHAILHGSVNNFDNQVNAAKLLTYFYLILELEPVLNILFDDK